MTAATTPPTVPDSLLDGAGTLASSARSPLAAEGRATQRDVWLLPVLRLLAPSRAVASLDPATDGGYWEAAIRAGLASDEEILRMAAQHARVHAVTDVAPSAAACDIVPERLAMRYGIVPVACSATTLEVATSNPYDLDCERTLAFATGRDVVMVLASPLVIRARLEEAYRSPAPEPVDTGNGADAEELDDARVAAAERAAAARPVVRLVDRVVARGIAERASDIHLEPEEGGIALRYRIDGVLRPAGTIPRAMGLPLVSRIKIMARMDIADRLRPQGGRAHVTAGGARVDLRVSTLPAAHGEKVVIRILDPRTAGRSVGELGMDPGDRGRLLRLLDAREGVVLVTGPTGSGKTTTLYALLRELLARGLNVVTVEDPVEFRVPGMVQVQVNERAGLTFAAALRSILRQDPDVILVGEIRDAETAAIALQAALTGHLVLATVHTIDACGAVTRLRDLGADPARLAASLRGIVAQRLVRRVCGSCVERGDTEPLPQAFWDAVPSGAVLVRGRGCPACGGTGFHGRLAVTEVVVVDEAIAALVASGAAAATLTDAVRRSGARSLWECGIARLVEGETTAGELSRVLEVDERVRRRGLEERARDASLSVVSEGAYHSTDEPEATPAAGAGAPIRVRRGRRPPVFRDRRRRGVTRIRVGVVDVYVVDPSRPEWRVLALRRAAGGRCPGGWEGVHGRIADGERPEEAALRELREETGLDPLRLYNVTVHGFYLHATGTVEMAVVFCAIADSALPLHPGIEHDAAEWLGWEEATSRMLWPQARQALSEIRQLLAGGDAGPAEDVLRVR